MSTEAWIAIAGVCLSIIGSALVVSHRFGVRMGEMSTRLGAIDTHLKQWSASMQKLDDKVDDHERRITILEHDGDHGRESAIIS